MISFRLTTEEYDRFRELSLKHNIRSVSEMIRAAVNLLFQQPGRVSEEALESRVAELEGRLQLISLEVKKLNQTVPETSRPLISKVAAGH